MKVLKFGAVWCGGCLVMKPRFEEIEKELPWLETEYFDVDENPEYVKNYNITDYPCFIFLDKTGKEFKRMYGEIDKKELVSILENFKDK